MARLYDNETTMDALERLALEMIQLDQSALLLRSKIRRNKRQRAACAALIEKIEAQSNEQNQEQASGKA